MRFITDIRFIIALCVIVLIARNIYSYHATYQYSLQNRAAIASQNRSTIHIAAVWDLDKSRNFIDGVKLAVNEVNQEGITLQNNKKQVTAQLVLHQFDDSTKDQALKSRMKIAGNHNIVAVVGHSSSSSAVVGSITYEYNGILFLSVVATDPELTNHGFRYTFSIIPSTDYFVDSMISFLQQKRWHKIMALHARNQYGQEMYERFAAKVNAPLSIVKVKSFSVSQKDYKALIYDVMDNEFDAVFLAAVDKNGANMIRQLREMGVTKPIIGGDGFDNLKIWNWSNQKANQTFVASIFVDQDGFVNRFKKAYGREAGYLAYQGYQAVRVLADAIRKTGSSEPLRVASTLKYYDNKNNIYNFDSNGLVRDLKIYIKQMKNGKFELTGGE